MSLSCGLFAGLRLGEWALDACKSEIAYKLARRNEPQALCLCNVRLESADHGHYRAVGADVATNLKS
jgi:hypothetical protein